ncbi:MAG TPA: hypothetical protein VFV13_11140 [Acidimicrobiia bacterium]|nr:hypothetical protein [Acidimicrobiia bacterium]
MTVPILATTPLLAALAWAAALAVDPGPFAPESVLLMMIGVLTLATVGMVGLTVTGGTWAHRTSLVALTGMFAIAIARPIDVIWVISLIVTVIGAVALLVPPLTTRLRRLPPAAGPPTRAVLVPLVLIGFPFPLGLAAWDRTSTTTLIIGITAPLAALWFARVFPGGLIAVRIAWPALAIGLAFTQWLAPAVVSLCGGISVAVLAWHRTVAIAFHPPRERGTVYPIPPELAPREVLDSADLDERGRRKP